MGSARVREGGIGYVLFWTNDPVDPDAEATRRSFSQAIEQIAPGSKVSFLFLSQIVDLVQRYPGVALAALGLGGDGILAPAEWRTLFEGAFQSDAGETRHRGAATHAESTRPEDAALMRVYGDAGVGKSRTVFEAIDVDGLRERT